MKLVAITSAVRNELGPIHVWLYAAAIGTEEEGAVVTLCDRLATPQWDDKGPPMHVTCDVCEARLRQAFELLRATVAGATLGEDAPPKVTTVLPWLDGVEPLREAEKDEEAPPDWYQALGVKVRDLDAAHNATRALVDAHRNNNRHPGAQFLESLPGRVRALETGTLVSDPGGLLDEIAGRLDNLESQDLGALLRLGDRVDLLEKRADDVADRTTDLEGGPSENPGPPDKGLLDPWGSDPVSEDAIRDGDIVAVTPNTDPRVVAAVITGLINKVENLTDRMMQAELYRETVFEQLKGPFERIKELEEDSDRLELLAESVDAIEKHVANELPAGARDRLYSIELGLREHRDNNRHLDSTWIQRLEDVPKLREEVKNLLDSGRAHVSLGPIDGHLGDNRIPEKIEVLEAQSVQLRDRVREHKHVDERHGAAFTPEGSI